MFVCDDLRTEIWRPDFSSSSQRDPTWTRVTCRGIRITNSLEWVDWDHNAVQVILCDVCGHSGCESGGYVHISRLGEYILWSAPQVDSDDDMIDAPRFLRTLGALAIPVAVWDRWSEVPPASRLTRANYAAVADAWILWAGALA